MQKIILQIFDKVNTEIPNLIDTEQALAGEIEDVFKVIQQQIPQEYHDEIDRRLFEVSGLAERRGFELGVKYMARLLMDCLS